MVSLMKNMFIFMNTATKTLFLIEFGKNEYKKYIRFLTLVRYILVTNGIWQQRLT